MENKVGGDLICKRPETIVEARFKLTKKQNDILDMVFASIENDEKLKYQIDIRKYGQLYNIKNKSNIYGDLKKAIKTFEGKGFAITQKISKKKENRIYFSWFSSIQYLDGEGKIEIELGQKLKEVMLNAKKACFYQLKYSLNFHNIYSKRMYYYLKSFENSSKNGTGWRVDNLNELRTKLECPKSYDVYYEFKRLALNPAYEEINGNSDIQFEYEEIKTKKKVTQLKFNIKKNKFSQSLAVKDEVSATVTEFEEEEEKNKNPIDKIKNIMSDSKITTLEAKKLLDTANGNINVIKEKYSQAQNVTKIDSVVGWMLKAIKENYQAPKSKNKNGNFNNYEQRPFDPTLEAKLINWGTNETDDVGEEFQQGKY
ncbi:MAG TPA: RepB family plasmid replication initiator protein [Clostridium sp.]|uniref:replication initiation protein n=1 Tax=Clostridium sp. TaxID=1506 RepID=UPI002F92C72D